MSHGTWVRTLESRILSTIGFRRLDAVSKLLGVALISVALEVGIVSTLGSVLAVSGVLLGVCSVFFGNDQS